MTTHVLTVENLTKRYGGSHTALERFSMAVPKGAIYGVIGRNGAGKTTLIRIICGLQSPTEGGFTLYGASSADPSAAARARRRMGAMVETPSLYLDMTARDNLRQQFRILGLPSFEGVEDLLRLVGLEDTGKKKVRHFSLGMKQRLGIAVALAGDPDFLVLDEPVNGLDPQGIIEIRELILKLNRERGITFLISSHILDELARLATHYGFIDHGHMLREISAEALEAQCRKCVRLTVSDTRPMPPVLDRLGLDYAIRSGTEADVYGQADVTAMTIALHAAGCDVKSVHDRNETLESYYVNLVGGGEHRA